MFIFIDFCNAPMFYFIVTGALQISWWWWRVDWYASAGNMHFSKHCLWPWAL